MPKATLEFDLSNFDDAAAHAKALAGASLVDTLLGIDERFRRALKNGALDGVKLTAEQCAMLERVREILREEAQERSVEHLLTL